MLLGLHCLVWHMGNKDQCLERRMRVILDKEILNYTKLKLFAIALWNNECTSVEQGRYFRVNF